MSCGIVIAAAGQGKRMGLGYNKQFIELNNKPVIVHTIEKFQNISWIDEIILVVNANEVDYIKHLIEKYNLTISKIVIGGKERQDSIEKGLSYIESNFVMIHDGARPFINYEILDKLFTMVKKYDAATLGVPVKDTIKIVDKNGIINYTPDRNSLWSIQTPQAFRISIIKEAYEKARTNNIIGTDDSSLVEMINVKVHIVMGDYRNIKITTKEDILVAQTILNNWGDI